MSSTKGMVSYGDALDDGEGDVGSSAGGQIWSVFIAALLAVVAAVVVAAIQPQDANAAPTVSVRTCGGGTIQLSTAESQILSKHNQARIDNGLPKLCVHPLLTKAARSHSQEMIDKDYFAHESFNGETDIARMQRFGYTSAGYSFTKYGENIYWGTGTSGSASSAHAWWMNSSGHRANILDPDFRQVGIGVRKGNFQGQDGASLYTVDFGVRRR